MQTTLLTTVEIDNVLECLPPKTDISKLPPGFSFEHNKRGLSPSSMDIVRVLTDHFSSKSCIHCVNYGEVSNHPIWTCPSVSLRKSQRAALKEIYKKYHHVPLTEYDLSDLKIIYDLFKQKNIINYNPALSVSDFASADSDEN